MPQNKKGEIKGENKGQNKSIPLKRKKRKPPFSAADFDMNLIFGFSGFSDFF